MTLRRIARLGALAAFAIASPATAVDWSPHADERVVEVVTHDEDGGERTTKIWLVVVDGAAYIRTGNTGWGGNVERDPEVRLLTASGDYDLRVEFVTDAATRDAVTAAFREKYGWSDRLISPFRGRNPKIMHLLERDAAP
jgi:hypothetical protein